MRRFEPGTQVKIVKNEFSALVGRVVTVCAQQDSPDRVRVSHAGKWQGYFAPDELAELDPPEAAEADEADDFEVLREFLALPQRAEPVLEKFAALPGAVKKTGGELEGFVYVPATRKNAVLLVAHADTVADDSGGVELDENEETIRNKRGILGADDRAGCAMLRQLRDTGHGLLVTDGEEYGSFGVAFLATKFPELYDEINRRHRFMIQIDRRGSCDFKCYNVGTKEFRAYIKSMTHFVEPDRSRSTDIAYLCRDICGVNLSCGYYNEHTPDEYLVKAEWRHTLQLLRSWLSTENLPQFRRTPAWHADALQSRTSAW